MPIVSQIWYVIKSVWVCDAKMDIDYLGVVQKITDSFNLYFLTQQSQAQSCSTEKRAGPISVQSGNAGERREFINTPQYVEVLISELCSLWFKMKDIC